MSSAETPDDREQPPFDFDQWLFKTVALVTFVVGMLVMPKIGLIMVGAGAVLFAVVVILAVVQEELDDRKARQP